MFEAVFNFRDIGGATRDGGRVRTGRVFRAGSLHVATPHDRAQLDGLGVRTVFDLRLPLDIVRSAPDRLGPRCG